MLSVPFLQQYDKTSTSSVEADSRSEITHRHWQFCNRCNSGGQKGIRYVHISQIPMASCLHSVKNNTNVVEASEVHKSLFT